MVCTASSNAWVEKGFAATLVVGKRVDLFWYVSRTRGVLKRAKAVIYNITSQASQHVCSERDVGEQAGLEELIEHPPDC